MLESAMIDYLKAILGITPKIEVFNKKSSLPLHLRSIYKLYTIQLLDHTFLLAHKSPSEIDVTPANMCKHMEILSESTGIDAVLILDSIDAFLRKKLIEHRISFIVPGKQMYLPLLMIDLREVYSKQREIRKMVSPSTQLVILYNIYNSLPKPFTPKETGTTLGYTKMTMSRVIDELEQHSLCRVEEKGKNRCVWMELENQALWDSVVHRLRSPVKRKVFVTSLSKRLPGVLSGISALAKKTLLAADDLPVCAVTTKQLTRLLQSKEITIVEHAYTACFELEVWYYNPSILTEEQTVDDLSLFLSLKDENDERIQLALTELMENFKWR